MNLNHDNDNIRNADNGNEKFPSVEETEEDLCRTLWIGVIVQAIIDATGKACNRIDQDKAIEWLRGKEGITSEFAEVCNLAGIDFELTRKRCGELSRGESIDFRCLKKPKMNNRTKEDRKRYFRRAEKNARLRRGRREQALASRMDEKHVLNDNHPQGENDNLFNQPMEKAYD